MNIEWGKSDLHIHTLVSDGYMTPDQVLDTALELGLKQISITDHDAVGAYFNFGDHILSKAQSLGIELIPGIELDCDYLGGEVHMLGYGIDPSHKELRQYLAYVQGLRKKKTKEQMEAVNRHFRGLVIDEKDLFLPYRDTLMRPHLVHAMLERGLFDEYRPAARWLNANIKVDTYVPKPDYTYIIQLIIDAGGEPVLAHPGFLIRERGLEINGLFADMKDKGLMGVEVEYPYTGTSPQFSAPENGVEIIELVKQSAKRFDLYSTRGSDAHSLEQFKALNS